MQKKAPVTKKINGVACYARKFTLAAVNEMQLATSQSMYGLTAVSRAEMKAFVTDGATVEEIGRAMQDHMKMPIVSLAMQQTVINSLRLRHSLCNADGVLLYSSVPDMENVIDPDDVNELLQLVAKANPIKTQAAELEQAEKN